MSTMPGRVVAIDIGNSRINMGIFEGEDLVSTYITPTEAAEEAATFLNRLEQEPDNKKENSQDFSPLEKIALASVVPSAQETLIRHYNLNKKQSRLFCLTAENQKSVKNIYQTAGADRIANAAAARALHLSKASAPAAVVLDFGTATTLTAVSRQGDFLGGFITLGLGRTLSALNSSTAQLPAVKFEPGALDIKVLKPAFNTSDSIYNGTILAHLGLVNFWLETALKDLPKGTIVIATGGLSTILGPHIDGINVIDQNLTLKGIKIAAEEATDPGDPG